VSSHAETRFALEDASPNHLRFGLERVMRTQYRIDDFQESYFVLRDLEELLAFAHIDFAPLYERISGQPEQQPGDVLPGDSVFQQGTGSHHRARRQGA
jgi:phenylalanine-4-hydroxylase